MPQFKKKPVVIEAEQWHGPDTKIEGVYEATEATVRDGQRIGHYYVDTLEGFFQVTPGDWIITGIKGEKYPCKPYIFSESYEAAIEELREQTISGMAAAAAAGDAEIETAENTEVVALKDSIKTILHLACVPAAEMVPALGDIIKECNRWFPPPAHDSSEQAFHEANDKSVLAKALETLETEPPATEPPVEDTKPEA